jgi:hypothetical protein
MSPEAGYYESVIIAKNQGGIKKMRKYGQGEA